MCEPTTLAVIGIGGGLIAGGLAAKGQYDSDQQTADAMNQDARMRRLAARDALGRGALESGQARMEGSKVVAEQKVAFASSGVDAGVGSPVALMAESRAMSELDAQTIKSNALREAWGLKTEAGQLDSQARKVRSGAKLRAIGSILGTAAGTAGSAYGAYGGKGGG